MKNLALITGASGGIGAEFARLHAATGGDAFLVARSAERLELLKAELESEHHVRVHTLAIDLSVEGAAQQVFQAVESANLAVDILINNAGFGDHDLFHDCDLAKQEAMMRLNMGTLTSLTRLVLPGMIERGRGRVLNVASTAAFMPGPLQAVYYATKAYVLSFSQAITEELRDTGVSVTALCPGPVKTGFVAAGDLEDVKAFKNAASPRSVAECGYQAMQRGKLIAINDPKLSFMLNWVIPFLPRKTVLKLSRNAMEKTS